jgi:hypothetical protein
MSQPSKYCGEWAREVEHNPATSQEYNAFKKSPEVESVIESVSNRLGFTESISYGMCVLLGSGTEKRRTFYN